MEQAEAERTAIIGELARIQEEDPECFISQFRSLPSAWQYRRLYETMGRIVPRGADVLDWGCGDGHFSYALERLGYRVSGFDFQDLALRKHLSADYAFSLGSPGEASRLPYPSERFDAVASVGVLEHVRETGGTEAASLREILRVLRPGGSFICYHLPNRYSLIDLLARLVPGKHHHRYRYTGRVIRELCAATGFQLIELVRYGALPRNVWNRAPMGMRWSPVVATVWDFLDSALRYPLSPVCQNYLFVARKERVEPS